MNAVKGSVVKSTAGRDQGRYFVAVAAEDRFVFIADGKERRLENPKRKNVKHISPTAYTIDITGMTDKKLKSFFQGFKPKALLKPARPDEMKEKRDFSVKRRCN